MTKFEFTLKAQQSKLNNITCYEPINIDYLDKLIRSDLLKTTFNNPFATYKYSNERKQLLEYKKLYDYRTKMCKIKYEKVKKPQVKATKKTKKTEEETNDDEYIAFGRVNPEKALGLFNIRREIRQTLCKDYLIDIDIDNAHPSILYQLCKMYDIDTDKLEDYVKDRANKLKEVQELYKCSKDEAKTLYIILLYFGSFNTWVKSKNITNDDNDDDLKPTKFCEKFKKELGEIGAVIIDQNKDIVNFVEERKGAETNYNKIGSVTSYYLQEIENRILETLYSYCVKNKYIVNNVCVLAADGIMIEKDKFKPEILNEFKKVIKDKFGFDLNFSVKNMTQDYISILDDHILNNEEYEIELLGGYETNLNMDKNEKFSIHKLTEYFNEDIQQLGNNDYQDNFNLTKSFKYFNQHHCFFYQSASVYNIHNTSVIKTYSNFDKSFEELVLKDNKDKYITKFTKLYNECQQKKRYSNFSFEPNKKEKDDEYNLFNGFKYNDDNNDYNINDINIFLEHIKYLTNNDEAATNYIINWISHIVQKPEQKTRVCIVFYSQTEQIGKNLLLDILGEVFHGYTNKIKDTNALTDRFNGDMMGKLFVVGDEINARAQDICNELKDIITRETEIIEFKGKDKINVNDYKNYVMTTNNENVFKISNSDKRFVFIECPDVRKDEKYYNNLVEFKKDPVKLKQLYNYFKTKDIKTFQTIKIVTTEYKKHLMLSNLPAYFRFIKDEYDLLNTDESIPVNILYKMSIEYARKNRLQSTYTDRLFTQQMHNVLGQFKILKNRKVEYKFPTDNGLKGDKKLEGVDYIKKIFEEKLFQN
jgi:hypothetical protein